jgi:hypothetical protein
MPIVKYVTKEQKKIMGAANEIIEQVREHLTYGSGNQRDSKPGALERTRKAYEMGRKENYGPDDLFPRRYAIAAIAAESGNCDHTGSYAYMLARNAFGPEYQVALCSDPDMGHTFCAVGKPGWPRGQYVAIDPWPINTEAMLLEDHCSLGEVPIFNAKPGKSINFSKYDEMLEEKQQEMTDHWNSLTEEKKIEQAPRYNHQYAFQTFGEGRNRVPRTVEYLVGEHNVMQPMTGENEAGAGGGELVELHRALDLDGSSAHDESSPTHNESPAYAGGNEVANAEGGDWNDPFGELLGPDGNVPVASTPPGSPAHNESPAYAGGNEVANAEGGVWDDHYLGLLGADGNWVVASPPPQWGTSVLGRSRSRSPLGRNRPPSPERSADTLSDSEEARAVAALLEWLDDEDAL